MSWNLKMPLRICVEVSHCTHSCFEGLIGNAYDLILLCGPDDHDDGVVMDCSWDC
jgi:hypothetical protein